MKKCLLLVLFALALVVSGCSQTHYTAYVEAVNRTEVLVSGQTRTTISYQASLKDLGLPEEEAAYLAMLEGFEATITSQYNKDKGLYLTDVYAVVGGLGLDFEILAGSDEVYIQMPLIGDYVRFKPSEVTQETMDNLAANQIQLSATTIQGIQDAYLASFNEEQIIKGQATVRDTLDGQVKATQFTVSLSEDQIKNFVEQVKNLVLQDAGVQLYFDNQEWGISLEDLDKIIGSLLETLTIDHFNLVEYIDKDGYIVDSEFDLGVTFNHQDALIEGINLKVASNLSLINDLDDLQMPVIDPARVIELEDLDSALPQLLERFD